uniref:RNase H type-1 domain-containing protein n=1 Tax=Lactuca sativa TaxID=4236 RepID=A0A9R1V162_LACSA|nr:hypothetical protein LSAT_V11C700371330 [Lactuca sativa]
MADSDRQEHSGGAPDQQWTLYTDGASNKEGSGVGLILTSPIGEEVTYALHFDFHTSNNEAEYEALHWSQASSKDRSRKSRGLDRLAPNSQTNIRRVCQSGTTARWYSKKLHNKANLKRKQ